MSCGSSGLREVQQMQHTRSGVSFASTRCSLDGIQDESYQSNLCEDSRSTDLPLLRNGDRSSFPVDVPVPVVIHTLLAVTRRAPRPMAQAAISRYLLILNFLGFIFKNKNTI